MARVKFLDPNDERRRLDRYELIGEIASGGMASVFLARLPGVGGFQRFVAIKRLHPHLVEEQEFVEMFLDEARLAAGIHNPHVVPILEVGTTESGYYLVMEYIEGDTLARVVARALSNGAGVPVPIAVRIVLDALTGLHAAHELRDADGNASNLVHRDCSPQNILVGVDGCTRLTDFGVARAASRLSSTRSDKLKGKLAYMSPEQTRGGGIDRRSDLFAMGTILWEVLAGRRLFKTDSEAATLSKVLIEPIPRLSTVAPNIPLAFDDICATALERDAAVRYQSAAEMAEALERAARESALSGTDGIASPREVAAYMVATLGGELTIQRDSIRQWLSQSDPNSGNLTHNRPGPRLEPNKTPSDRFANPNLDPNATIPDGNVLSPAPTTVSSPSLTSASMTFEAGRRHAESLPPDSELPSSFRSRRTGPVVAVLVSVAAMLSGALLWIKTQSEPAVGAPLPKGAADDTIRDVRGQSSHLPTKPVSDPAVKDLSIASASTSAGSSASASMSGRTPLPISPKNSGKTASTVAKSAGTGEAEVSSPKVDGDLTNPYR